MNPSFIYRKIESVSRGSVSDFPLRFATEPDSLPEDTAYVVCAVSLQADPELAGNHTAEATIEFSLVIPLSPDTNRSQVETDFARVLSDLYENMSLKKLNDPDLSGDAPVRFYSVYPDNIPAPEYDEFRITQSIVFKANVQF